MPRLFDPPSFITEATPAALCALPGYAWDVIPAPTFADALGVADKMLTNRWLYRRPEGMPPFEPVGRWVPGRGGARVIRKDRALAWARSGGRAVPASECWIYAADDLAKLGWPGLHDASGVQQILSILFECEGLRPAYRPVHAATLDGLYVDDDDISVETKRITHV